MTLSWFYVSVALRSFMKSFSFTLSHPWPMGLSLSWLQKGVPPASLLAPVS